MSVKVLETLIDEFNKLPGIGRKSATRLAFYMMESPEEEIESFVEAIKSVREKAKKCKICGNIAEEEICEICSDETREIGTICVVDVRDIVAFEKARFYTGVYHVLGGKIAPLMGIGADKLSIKALLERIAREDIKEVIIALNPDLEGETTTLYLNKLIEPFGVKITKLASGIPVGGNIEFADSATLYKSLKGRTDLK